MIDRKLIINVNEGEVVDVFVCAALDKTYQKLFKSACRSAERNSNNAQHVIKIFIFGSFWLEASCNNLLKYVVESEIKSEVATKVLWDKLKIIPILEKIDIFYRLSPVTIANKYKDLRKQIKAALDVRNRLAHFKDAPEEASVVRGDLFETLTSNIDLLGQIFDVPSIAKLLKWEAAQQHVVTIIDAHKFLTSVERHLQQKQKSKTKNISRASLLARAPKNKN